MFSLLKGAFIISFMYPEEKYTVLGVMSGTSLDGLDLVITDLIKSDRGWEYHIYKADTVPYRVPVKKMLKEAYHCSGRRLTEIDAVFGQYIGEQAKLFIDASGISIDFISSHGHTVFHEPQKKYTLQIGSGARIAATTGYKTVCNFRNLDVALGGQGAPLVPIGDELLFENYKACLNIGGFANVSYQNNDGHRIAFDICAANFILNKLSQRLEMDYDEGGKIAAGGKRIVKLASDLNNTDYYDLSPPKSLGQEWVDLIIIPILGKFKQEPVRDLLYTYTEHIAFQISRILNNIGDGVVLVTGGGAHNLFLIEKIREYSKPKLKVPEFVLINYKEALIFALLGTLRIRNEINCLGSVTGACKNNSGGTIYAI